MTDSNFLLDPFSTIIYLALLPYKPEGIKIGIQDNRITYFYDHWLDRVRRTFYDRFYCGYSRIAILHLKSPIKRAIEWYCNDRTTEAFVLARSGLESLRGTYDTAHDETSTAVKQLLSTYIALLDQPTRREHKNSDSIGDNFTDAELNSLRDAWTLEELDIVNEMFKLIKQAPAELQDARVNNIEVFVGGKQPQLLKILHRRTRCL
jgi:hypothetical protein